MADMLSRSEVESLLSALDSNPAGHKPNASGAAASFSSLASTEAKSSSELARAAVQFLEPFRHQFRCAGEALLGEPVRMKRHMPMRVSLVEMIAKRESADRLFLLESDRDGSDLLLLLEQTFVAPLVSNLLGGETSEPSSPRGGDSLETRLLERFCRDGATGAHPTSIWNCHEIDASLSLGEYAQRNPPAEWWCETWELKTSRIRGVMRFAAPWAFLADPETGRLAPREVEDRDV